MRERAFVFLLFVAIGWEGNGSSCHGSAIATSVCLFYSEYAYKHVHYIEYCLSQNDFNETHTHNKCIAGSLTICVHSGYEVVSHGFSLPQLVGVTVVHHVITVRQKETRSKP